MLEAVMPPQTQTCPQPHVVYVGSQTGAVLNAIERELRYEPWIETGFTPFGICISKQVQFPSGLKALWKEERLPGAVWAYEFAQHIGFTHLVPLTVQRGPQISLIQWISGTQHGRQYYHRYNDYRDLQPKALREFCLFDSLVATTDRHMENWLVDKANRIIAIDNEGAFPGYGFTPHTVFELLKGHPLTPTHYNLVDGLLTRPERWPKFLKLLDTNRQSAFVDRLTQVFDRGSYI